MRKKFVYSCSIKSPCFRIQRTLGKQFLPPAGCENVFPAKSCQMLEELVVSWREVRWRWWMRQNTVAQFVHLLKRWLCDVVGRCRGEELGPYLLHRWWLQALLFLVRLVDLRSILVRCNGFTGIQKAVVGQTQPQTTTHHDLFLVQVWIWEVLWSFVSVQPLNWWLLVVIENPLFVALRNPIKKWFVV